MAISTSAAGAYATAQKLLSSTSKPSLADTFAGSSAKGGDFTAMLEQAVNGVGEAGRKAESQALSVAGGKADLVDVVTAVAESETALQTLVAVRDRVISAYEEIMRMQI